MFPRTKPERHHFARVVVNRPPKPNLMVFIVIKAPHFIHFDTDFAARMDSEVFLVYATYEVFLFFNTDVTVSLWIPRQREIARVPLPFTDNLTMDDLISGLQAG
jgi:hypothetical protein